MTRGRRQNQIRAETPILLVICQDTGGVLTYLEDTIGRRSRSDKVSVLIRGAGKDSRTLGGMCTKALSGKSREFPNCSHFFIVFDQDDDQHVKTVVQNLWHHKSAETFLSAPCFEYFFALHFSAARPAANSYAELLPVIKQLTGFSNYSKKTDAVPVSLLYSRQGDALINASLSRVQCLIEQATGPYTELDLLIDAVTLAKAQGLEALKQTMTERNAKRFHFADMQQAIP